MLMSKIYLPFLVFVILFILTFPLFYDYAISKVPGWNTNLYPPLFVSVFIVSISLIPAIIGYWLMAKKINKINWPFFLVHLIFTIPIILLLKWPYNSRVAQVTEQTEQIKSLENLGKLAITWWVLFFAGQILFILFCIRSIMIKSSAKKQNK